jgi:hypothetical protein
LPASINKNKKAETGVSAFLRWEFYVLVSPKSFGHYQAVDERRIDAIITCLPAGRRDDQMCDATGDAQ